MKPVFTFFALVLLAGTALAQAPIITLLGKDTVRTQKCHPYVPAGATAYDPVDGDITGSIVFHTEITDLCVEGIYTETYTVENSSGLSDTAYRTVFIVKDNTPPVITVPAPNPYYLEARRDNPNYQEPSVVTAWDSLDGDITTSIVRYGFVNTKMIGTYKLVYIVSDVQNNRDTAERLVIVRDTEAPVWNDTAKAVVIDLFSTFTDTLKAADAYDDNPVLKVTAGFHGAVNTFQEGIFPYTYTAEDQSGNKVMLERVYYVRDRMPPLINLNTADTVYVTLHSTYTPVQPGVMDNYSVPSEIILNIVFSDVNTHIPGTYREVWRAVDEAGNESETTRYVVVGNGAGIVDPYTLQLNCYPNPVKDMLSISGFNKGSDISLAIYNANGSDVMKQQVRSNIATELNTDISNLPSGMYVARVETNEGQAYLRFLKE